MTTRRTFLRLLGIGAPAAAVATPVWPCRAVTRKQLQVEYPNPATVMRAEMTPGVLDDWVRTEDGQILTGTEAVEIGRLRYCTKPGRYVCEAWNGKHWVEVAAMPNGYPELRGKP